MPICSGSIKDTLALHPLSPRSHGQSVGSWGSVLVMIFLRSVLGEQMEAHANQRFLCFAFICNRSILSVFTYFFPMMVKSNEVKGILPLLKSKLWKNRNTACRSIPPLPACLSLFTTMGILTSAHAPHPHPNLHQGKHLNRKMNTRV